MVIAEIKEISSKFDSLRSEVDSLKQTTTGGSATKTIRQRSQGQSSSSSGDSSSESSRSPSRDRSRWRSHSWSRHSRTWLCRSRPRERSSSTCYHRRCPGSDPHDHGQMWTPPRSPTTLPTPTWALAREKTLKIAFWRRSQMKLTSCWPPRAHGACL